MFIRPFLLTLVFCLEHSACTQLTVRVAGLLASLRICVCVRCTGTNNVTWYELGGRSDRCEATRLGFAMSSTQFAIVFVVLLNCCDCPLGQQAAAWGTVARQAPYGFFSISQYWLEVRLQARSLLTGIWFVVETVPSHIHTGVLCILLSMVCVCAIFSRICFSLPVSLTNQLVSLLCALFLFLLYILHAYQSTSSVLLHLRSQFRAVLFFSVYNSLPTSQRRRWICHAL